MNSQEESTRKRPGLLQVTWSMIAAFCGVQSTANHERDNVQIEDTGFLPYIIVGVILTALFVGAVALVVKLILSSAS